MTSTTIVLTQNPEMQNLWEAPLKEKSLQTIFVQNEETLETHMQTGMGVIIDANPSLLSEDDLLWMLTLCKSKGLIPCVYLSNHEAFSTLQNLLHCICEGRVVTNQNQIPQIVSLLAHLLIPLKQSCIEYATISSDEKSLLFILGHGQIITQTRPISNEDDLSEIENIQIEQDAQTIFLKLSSGKDIRFKLNSETTKTSVPDHRTSEVPELIFDSELIGARLRSFRIAAGLTQAELSEKTGIYRPNIARVEAGRHTPALETLVKMTKALGISPFFVLSNETQPVEKPINKDASMSHPTIPEPALQTENN